MSIIAGLIGIVGICCLLSMFLYVPLLYSMAIVMLKLMVMITLGFIDIGSLIGIAISCMVVVLFYYNYKIVTPIYNM